MKIPSILRQYVWLINTLRNSGALTIDALASRWNDDDMDNGRPFSRSTFNRYRDAVLDTFGVIIDCRKAGRHSEYFIANPEVFSENTIEQWLLRTLTVGNALWESVSLYDRILLENVPEGEQFMPTIISAMRNNVALSLTYHRFGGTDKCYDVEPLAIKLFQRRWYLLGNVDGMLRTFSFDRITSVEKTSRSFTIPKDFKPKEYYNDFFGANSDKEVPIQKVVVRFYGWTINYIKTLPLHSSQQLVAQGDDFADFSYLIHPTMDFIDEILRYDDVVEVLEPKELRNLVIERYRRALSRYNN